MTIAHALFTRGTDIVVFENAANPYPLFGSDALTAYFFSSCHLGMPPFWAGSAQIAKRALENAKTPLHCAVLPFSILFLLCYFAHSLDFSNQKIIQNAKAKHILAPQDFSEFAKSMRILSENLHEFVAHFGVSDTFLNELNQLPQKITLFYADNLREKWRDAWQKEWRFFENADIFKIGSNAFELRFVDWRGTRTEKVGKAVLFPLKLLRSLIWRIEKNSVGKVAMKPLRFLWHIFYGATLRFYRLAHFLRNLKNAHTR